MTGDRKNLREQPWLTSTSMFLARKSVPATVVYQLALSEVTTPSVWDVRMSFWRDQA